MSHSRGVDATPTVTLPKLEGTGAGELSGKRWKRVTVNNEYEMKDFQVLNERLVADFVAALI